MIEKLLKDSFDFDFELFNNRICIQDIEAGINSVLNDKRNDKIEYGKVVMMSAFQKLFGKLITMCQLFEKIEAQRKEFRIYLIHALGNKSTLEKLIKSNEERDTPIYGSVLQKLKIHEELKDVIIDRQLSAIQKLHSRYNAGIKLKQNDRFITSQWNSLNNSINTPTKVPDEIPDCKPKRDNNPISVIKKRVEDAAPISSILPLSKSIKPKNIQHEKSNLEDRLKEKKAQKTQKKQELRKILKKAVKERINDKYGKEILVPEASDTLVKNEYHTYNPSMNKAKDQKRIKNISINSNSSAGNIIELNFNKCGSEISLDKKSISDSTSNLFKNSSSLLQINTIKVKKKDSERQKPIQEPKKSNTVAPAKSVGKSSIQTSTNSFSSSRNENYLNLLRKLKGHKH